MTQVTSPDNIPSPDLTDQYALTQDMAALADGTQAALVRRANSYKGTSAQRVAFTSAPDGTRWVDTNGARTEWERRGNAWVALRVQGTATISVSSSAGGTLAITFPANSFTTAPLVMVTKQSAGAAKFVPYVVNVTPAGFTAGIYSGDGSSATQNSTIGWVAFPQ